MTDLGPVRLLAVDESLRIQVLLLGEIDPIVLAEPTHWCLILTRTYRNSAGRLAVPYVLVPIATTLEYPREAWTDFENAFETLAAAVDQTGAPHAE